MGRLGSASDRQPSPQRRRMRPNDHNEEELPDIDKILRRAGTPRRQYEVESERLGQTDTIDLTGIPQ